MSNLLAIVSISMIHDEVYNEGGKPGTNDGGAVKDSELINASLQNGS